MPNTNSQLILPIHLHDEATFENFLIEDNEEAVTAVQEFVRYPTTYSVMYLFGADGAGCSHLLQAACRLAHAHQKRSVYLPLAELHHYSPDIFLGLEHCDIICVDDIHVISGQLPFEEALLHCYNRTLEHGGKLIFSSPHHPKLLQSMLADLSSRLSWGVVYSIATLTDSLKISALMFRAKKRGILLSNEVAHYLLSHCPRHLGTLMNILDTLDKASLAAQRRLTIPFIKKTLQL